MLACVSVERMTECSVTPMTQKRKAVTTCIARVFVRMVEEHVRQEQRWMKSLVWRAIVWSAIPLQIFSAIEQRMHVSRGCRLISSLEALTCTARTRALDISRKQNIVQAFSRLRISRQRVPHMVLTLRLVVERKCSAAKRMRSTSQATSGVQGRSRALRDISRFKDHVLRGPLHMTIRILRHVIMARMQIVRTFACRLAQRMMKDIVMVELSRSVSQRTTTLIRIPMRKAGSLIDIGLRIHPILRRMRIMFRTAR